MLYICRIYGGYMGRKRKIETDSEPSVQQLRKSQAEANRLEKKWKQDIEEIRKALRRNGYDDYDEEQEYV